MLKKHVVCWGIPTDSVNEVFHLSLVVDGLLPGKALGRRHILKIVHLGHLEVEIIHVEKCGHGTLTTRFEL